MFYFVFFFTDFVTNVDHLFWIGLHDPEENRAWEWSDSSSFSFEYWRPGEPGNGDEFCVLVRNNLRFLMLFLKITLFRFFSISKSSCPSFHLSSLELFFLSLKLNFYHYPRIIF